MSETSQQSVLLSISKKYLIFLFIYMVLYEFFDSYTKSYYTVVVSYIEADFGIGDDTWYLIQAIASLGLFTVLGIQYLTDVVGRKPMIIIAFFGMGAASLLLYLSPSPWIFSVGFFFLWMFFSSDIWVIIVSEETPKNYRARLTSIVTVLGALGSVAIFVCMTIFVGTIPASEDPSLWRTMTYLGIVAIPLSLLGFGIRDTRAFKYHQSIKTRVTRKNLLAPFVPEYRKKVFVFIIIGFLMGITTAVSSTVEVYLTSIISDRAAVNICILMATVGPFTFHAITGFLSDRFGRKKILCTYIIITLVSISLFAGLGSYLGPTKNYIALYVLSFLFNGSFWVSYMISKTYCVECFPTTMRGTATGWRAFSYAFGITTGSLIASAIVILIGREMLYIIAALLAAVIIIPLVLKFLPETKGVEIVTI
jgi:MFS family permease